MKKYLKPEAEYISLVAEEEITTGQEILGEEDAEMGLTSSLF